MRSTTSGWARAPAVEGKLPTAQGKVISGTAVMRRENPMRSKRDSPVSTVYCVLGLLFFSGSASAGPPTEHASTTAAQSFINYAAPGAGTQPGQGTVGFGNNVWGTITGFTRDSNWVRHGFLRLRNGAFTVFDDPNAGTCSTPCESVSPGTRAYSINDSGAVTGFWTDSSNVAYAFVRARNGEFTEFHAPDAGTGPGQGTYPGSNGAFGINAAGAIMGAYVDSSSVQHGFVRSPNGQITEFDPENSLSTNPVAIDFTGAITGYYCDSTTNNFRGFLRTPNGRITVFDGPGAGSDDCNNLGTFVAGVEPLGGAEGNYSYTDASGVYMSHGFLRDAQGAFTTFDPPGSQATYPGGNNVLGTITGGYIGSDGVFHGFVRGPFGKFISFDVGAPGTVTPESINLEGEVSGTDLDASGVQYAFVGNPFFNGQDQFDSESATATPSVTPRDPKVILPARNDRNRRLPGLN